jgi:hypothetical protein
MIDSVWWQAASLASTFISPSPLLAQKSPSSFALEGQGRGRREGSASREETLTVTARIGAHY